MLTKSVRTERSRSASYPSFPPAYPQQHGHQPLCAFSSIFLAWTEPSGVWKYLQFKIVISYNNKNINNCYRLVLRLSYLFLSSSFDFEVLQVKYCTSMVNGAGMAVRLVSKNCLVTTLVNFTLSPKSSDTAWRLLSSGAALKNQRTNATLVSNISLII